MRRAAPISGSIRPGCRSAHPGYASEARSADAPSEVPTSHSMQPISDLRRTNPMRTDVPVGTALLAATWPPEGQSAHGSISTPARQNKNTGDLQWEMRANYNANHCADERKAAGARTMRAMEKTMRGAMKTMKNPGADVRPVVMPEDRQWGCVRLAARRTERVCRILG